MTIYLPALAGIISSLLVGIALTAAGYGNSKPGLTLGAIAIVVMLLWYYSPLPDDNGTHWGREPYMQEWGFTNEPRSENE